MASHFKVYDKVWVMRNNQPTELLVFATVDSMDYSKRGTETHYRLVESTVGAGWGNKEGTRYTRDRMFTTREDLIDSI